MWNYTVVVLRRATSGTWPHFNCALGFMGIYANNYIQRQIYSYCTGSFRRIQYACLWIYFISWLHTNRHMLEETRTCTLSGLACAVDTPTQWNNLKQNNYMCFCKCPQFPVFWGFYPSSGTIHQRGPSSECNTPQGRASTGGDKSRAKSLQGKLHTQISKHHAQINWHTSVDPHKWMYCRLRGIIIKH